MNMIGFHEGKSFIFDNDVVGASWRWLLSSSKLKQGYLSVGVTLPVTTLTLPSTKGFEDTGSLDISGSTVTYTGRTATTFTGCSGGTGVKAAATSVTQTGGIGAASTLSGGVNEVTYWTGGGRAAVTVPVPVSGIITMPQASWATGAQTNGPAVVRSVVLVTSADNTGTAIAAWHISDDGVSVSMVGPNASIQFTPVLFLANIGETS